MVIIIWACNPISFKNKYFWYPFLEPHLTTYHSKHRCPIKKSNWIRAVCLIWRGCIIPFDRELSDRLTHNIPHTPGLLPHLNVWVLDSHKGQLQSHSKFSSSQLSERPVCKIQQYWFSVLWRDHSYQTEGRLELYTKKSSQQIRVLMYPGDQLLTKMHGFKFPCSIWNLYITAGTTWVKSSAIDRWPPQDHQLTYIHHQHGADQLH
jgi:hypothetical protein